MNEILRTHLRFRHWILCHLGKPEVGVALLQGGGWEKVKAKVLSKEVVLKKQSTSKGTPYKIAVRYSYRYNNKDYQGDKFHLSELVGGFNSYMKSDADKRLAEIQNEVEIYVNPNDPSQSVMEHGGIFLYVVMLIMALFSFLIGFGYFFDKK